MSLPLFERYKADPVHPMPTSDCPHLLGNATNWMSCCLRAKVQMTVIALPHPLVVEDLGVSNLNIFYITILQTSFERGYQRLLLRLLSCSKD